MKTDRCALLAGPCFINIVTIMMLERSRQSPEHNPIENALHLLQRKLTGGARKTIMDASCSKSLSFYQEKTVDTVNADSINSLLLKHCSASTCTQVLNHNVLNLWGHQIQTH